MNVQQRIDALPWDDLGDALTAEGYAVTRLLSAAECRRISAWYDDDQTRFRKTIDMQRHNFGKGQYKYFDYPLPDLVQDLRQAFYPGLATIANTWAARLKLDRSWPKSLAGFTRQCRAAGQSRATPLLLRYGEGDYNCLHQDLYGDVYFPLQVIILLDAPGVDFDGGELVLVEQRPRMQSRPVVVPLRRGDAAIVPVRERPRQGAVRVHRAQLRHGVGEVRSGRRTTLGLIFHDAS